MQFQWLAYLWESFRYQLIITRILPSAVCNPINSLYSPSPELLKAFTLALYIQWKCNPSTVHIVSTPQYTSCNIKDKQSSDCVSNSTRLGLKFNECLTNLGTQREPETKTIHSIIYKGNNRSWVIWDENSRVKSVCRLKWRIICGKE